MTTTNEQSSAEVLSTVSGVLLKADVLGRVTLGREQREAMLDAFEASGMSGQAFGKRPIQETPRVPKANATV